MIPRPPGSPRTYPPCPSTPLFRSRIAVEVEAAVGPFDFHFLPDVQPFAELAGMVAQRLGDDRDATDFIVPAGRDGVRVCAFGAVRRYEGELAGLVRSEEHTSELQSIMHSSYAVFCLEKKNTE